MSNTSVWHDYGMFAACTRQRKLDPIAKLSLVYCCHVLFNSALNVLIIALIYAIY